jgi:SAM-dependent methyltransferase
VSRYTLPHDLPGEQERLSLMSELLDPMHQSHIEKLGLRPGWRCLEIGCGNGSISKWLATHVGPGGIAVAADLDPQLAAADHMPNLETRRVDIMGEPLEEDTYDLVTARALLHHLHSPSLAIERMAAALKPGGVLISIEPEFLPVSVAQPEALRAFWQGWLKWSVAAGIDYSLGRKMPGILTVNGLLEVGAEGHTAYFQGGSPWANYWTQTLRELGAEIVAAGYLTEKMLTEFYTFFSDAQLWTSVVTMVATWGRRA